MASALSNYQLGDLLGRGASGNVYRALNFLTGETVAIKSISVSTLPASSLPDLMSEIDLLKNLNHPNIVKYKGFARDKENLFIVLEYCENGSLQNILKRFGKFPESLVSIYMRQVLEGLVYLHEQGVIHRDIKGANILTNKDGSIKLADFGVSSRAPTPDLAVASSDTEDCEVVGSPYWMAPEVIEQSGATTSSDIWSVGCVVVELLEGKPPYGDLAPMQALWRIVQDESMRIPEGASPIVKDFLYQCFQKDPNLRVSAKKLLRHPWMQSVRRAADGAEKAATLRKQKDTLKETRTGAAMAFAPLDTPKEAKPEKTEFAEAIQRVQEWNEALNAAPKSSGTIRRNPAPPKKAPEPVRGRADSGASVQSATAPVPTAQNAVASGLLQKNQHVTDALSRARESGEAEKWDDDFAFDISIPKSTRKPPTAEEEAAAEQHDFDHETVRPSKESLKRAARSRLAGIVEDYSDLTTDKDDFETKLSNMKLQNKGRIRLMHPDDLVKIGTLKGESKPKPARPALPPLVAPPVQPQAPAPVLPPAKATGSPTTTTRTPPGSRSSSLRGRQQSESNLELLKYTEAEDEDYSDMFDGPVVKKDGNAGSLQLTRRSNRSWQEEEEEEDVDPFAELEDEFAVDNLEENLKRDKKATMLASIERLIDQLEVSTPQDVLKAVSEELLSLLETASPDMQLERHFGQNRGLLAVLEVLEQKLSRDLPMKLLKIVNFIVAVDVDNLESFCLVGGIPVMMPYTSKKHHTDTRLEASTFIQHLTRSPLTLQMFISCRGLKVLVELLDEDYHAHKTLILSALDGIISVFDLQSPTPKPDFCRMFTREGILDPLSTTLLALIKDKDVDEAVTKRAVDTLLLFCQVSQADSHVREAFGTRNIMIRLLRSLDLLPRKLLLTTIKAVKHLSTSPQLIEVLQNSNAVEVLVELLEKSLKGSYSNEISSHIFQTIYSMCRLSKSRQEEASAAGIIPLLKRVIDTNSMLKQFALPVLCDLANAGKGSRRLLWQYEGMSMYLGLLDDPYWRVSALEAVTCWMQDEPARVEDVLLERSSINCLSKCFVQSSSQSYERILDPFLKILRLSPQLTNDLVSTPLFLKRLAETLDRPTKAMITLNLLRIARLVLEHHPDRIALVTRFKFDAIIGKLAKQNDPVLVRELAKETLPVLVAGMPEMPPPPVPQPAPAPISPPRRKISIVRRASASTDSSSGSGSSSSVPRPRKPGHSVLGPPPPDTRPDLRESTSAPSRGITPTATAAAERKQKTQIARSHLKDVQWEAGDDGRLVRSPRPKHSRSGSASLANGHSANGHTNGH